jgi:hypothetical protein
VAQIKKAIADVESGNPMAYATGKVGFPPFSKKGRKSFRRKNMSLRLVFLNYPLVHVRGFCQQEMKINDFALIIFNK